MSQMLASTLRRPVSQARPMLAGSAAMAIRSSLLAVNRTWAGASDPFLPDRCGSVGTDPGHERHAEIRDLAADHAVHQVGLAIRLVHLGDPAGQIFQRLTAFLGGSHETPHFPLPPL